MASPPAAHFQVLLADPPWSYRVGEQSGRRGTADAQYATMTDRGICELQPYGRPVSALAADDSVLLMWATWPKLREAFDVISAWGFTYVTGLPWVKVSGTPYVDLWGDLQARPSYGVGFWFRGATEPLLVARRGKPPVPRDVGMLGLLGPRLEHSRKPDSVHEIAEHMPGPYLELFARRPREGWDVWGNEV